jgi:hypothetical protein
MQAMKRLAPYAARLQRINCRALHEGTKLLCKTVWAGDASSAAAPRMTGLASCLRLRPDITVLAQSRKLLVREDVAARERAKNARAGSLVHARSIASFPKSPVPFRRTTFIVPLHNSTIWLSIVMQAGKRNRKVEHRVCGGYSGVASDKSTLRRFHSSAERMTHATGWRPAAETFQQLRRR